MTTASVSQAQALQGAPPASPRRSMSSLIHKGFWAVADQGLFAGSNFILNVMLANWLRPREYGAFAAAQAAFLLMGVIHTAMLTEPMLVYAAERYRKNLDSYLGALMRGHILVSVGASVLLVLWGLCQQWSGNAEVAWATFGYALAGPFILFQWLVRRASYPINPRKAAYSGVLYLALMMGGLALVHHMGILGIGTALCMLAVSSLISGVWLIWRNVKLFNLPKELLHSVAVDHWRFGRWGTAAQLLGFIPANAYYFLPQWAMPQENFAALKALTNLFQPFAQANTALCFLLLPTFVRTKGATGTEGRRIHNLSLLVLAGGPLLYWLVIGTFHQQVFHLIYPKGQYAGVSKLVWIIGLQPVISGACGVYGALLRARQKLNAVVWGGVVAAVTAVILGTILTIRYGMAGVCWSIIITFLLHHITLWLFSRIGSKKEQHVETDEEFRMQLAVTEAASESVM